MDNTSIYLWDLRDILDKMVFESTDDCIEALWIQKSIDWDIDHLMFTVDELDKMWY